MPEVRIPAAELEPGDYLDPDGGLVTVVHRLPITGDVSVWVQYRGARHLVGLRTYRRSDPVTVWRA